MRCCDEAANHQLPTAVALWIIWIVSTEECSSLTQKLMQIRCSTYSVILNVMATQYTCSLNCIYRPHWLVQWSCHGSHMSIPVHSPWLPGYLNVTQTILVILTMAGIFLDQLICIVSTNIIFNYWMCLVSTKSSHSKHVLQYIQMRSTSSSPCHKSFKLGKQGSHVSSSWVTAAVSVGQNA